MNMKPKMNLTQEQLDILFSTGSIKINAVAGSGKTTTVIEYARSRPKDSKILYLVFNRSVKEEAKAKFEKKGLSNVKVDTAHSLAYNHIIPGSKYKVRSTAYKTQEIADLLKLNSGGVKHAEYMIANHINKFISLFCNSDKQNFSELNYMDVISDQRARDFVSSHYKYIEAQAEKLFHKMNAGEIGVTHDFYLKKFQLCQYNLKYDHILFDEGQDASAAILDVFMRQAAVKVIVGDTHQQIYSWRYAVNSLERVKFKAFDLSTSFRFGADIADLANRILGWKNYISPHEPLLIKGEGKTDACKTKAVIARTNLGLLLEAINFVTQKDKKSSIYFEGHINSYTYADDGASLYDVLNLNNGKRHLIRDKLICSMRNLSELEEYIEKTEDAQLGIMVDIVKEYGNAIPGLIREIKTRHPNDTAKANAEVIFSTVHRCKGMEYDEIFLAPDFITEKKIIDTAKKLKDKVSKTRLIEEINLLYVAITRAKSILHIPSELLPEDFPLSESIHIMRDKIKEVSVWPIPNTEDRIIEKSLIESERVQVPAHKIYTFQKIRKDHKDAYTAWTEELDRELILLMQTQSIKKLALHFGRTEGAIRSRMRKIVGQEQ